MANHKSAIKRHRQSLRRRDRNRETKLEIRAAFKAARTAITEGKVDQAKDLVKTAESKLAKAAGKGVFHGGNASRRVSRLHIALNKKAKPLV